MRDMEISAERDHYWRDEKKRAYQEIAALIGRISMKTRQFQVDVESAMRKLGVPDHGLLGVEVALPPLERGRELTELLDEYRSVAIQGVLFGSGHAQQVLQLYERIQMQTICLVDDIAKELKALRLPSDSLLGNFRESARVHEDVFNRLPEIARVDLGFPNTQGIHEKRFAKAVEDMKAATGSEDPGASS